LKPSFVDLHIHSTASDGSLSPLEIVQTAEKLGLKAIAITDHDTVDGSVEARGHEQAHDVEILSGIELSAELGSGTIHILGYLIRLDDMSLMQTLGVLQEARANRNTRIVDRLGELGVDISYDDILEASGGGQVGRPHFARVMVQKGIVKSMDGAFDRFLGKGGPAYVERYRLTASEAIEAILKAGGVPVLAHPSTVDAKTESELENTLVELKRAGLKGVEAYYPSHGASRTARYEGLANRHGLLVTGGSDFHGHAKMGVRIGVGRGNLRVPYRVVEALKKSAD
jgi:predicted metal-dependent phosphoesterase TrpH